ncbi:MAG: class I SAM-dependent methyltransferase [Arenimonas sp.]
MSTFKDHFSDHASSYAAARPRYPKLLFEWIASQCKIRALVWDAGCGNGQASIALAEYFDEVFASDPSGTQINSATPHANIRYAVEPAEQSSLPDNSADCICVAQALHWFDFERFFYEAKRVLRDDGLLVVWTYERSSVNESVDLVFQKLYRGTLDDYWPPERRHVEAAYHDIIFPLDEIQTPPFELRCDWNLSQYLAYLRSWSASQRYLKATGIDAVGLIENEMRQAWGNPEQVQPVLWPLTVRAGRFA